MARRKSRGRRSGATDWIDSEIEEVRRKDGLAGDSWLAGLADGLGVPAGLRRNFAAYVREHGLQLGPDWAAALVLFRDYASSHGVPDRARVIYERKLSGGPPCALVERLMGDVCLYRLAAIHRARRHYQAAASAAPDHAPAHYQLGQVCFLLGVFDRAREAWERAVATAGQGDEEDESTARALFNLGVLHVDSGAIGQGRRHFRRALELLPGYPEARGALAQLDQFEVRT